jgi:hypothetical protein
MNNYDFYYTVPDYNRACKREVKIRVLAAREDEKLHVDLVNLKDVQHAIKNTEWCYRDIFHAAQEHFEKHDQFAVVSDKYGDALLVGIAMLAIAAIIFLNNI